MDHLMEHSIDIMSRVPLIDGHNDWANTIRGYYKNNIDERFEHDKTLIGHVDMKRLLIGKSGGIFLSAYVDCPKAKGDYSNETHFQSVYETLQQIDLIHRLVERYDNYLELAYEAADIMKVFHKRKVAGILSIEGLHQIGNSPGILRTYYRLGVRCATLTHNESNRYASSATSTLEVQGGLSEDGRKLVSEMNRMGMLIDLSHTSDNSVNDVLDISKAPVCFTHSSCRALLDHVRNVSDDSLVRLKDNDGIIMISLVPKFTHVESSQADISHVIDHIIHASSIVGFDHVGIGSDFDGMPDTIKGLEDVSKFPNLVTEMLKRGIEETNVEKIIGQNIIRVFHKVELVAQRIRQQQDSAILEDQVKPLWSTELLEWCRSKWQDAEH